jgi:hypothetical protein
MALKLCDVPLGLVEPSLEPGDLPLVDWAVATAANAALAANITIEVRRRIVGSFRSDAGRPTPMKAASKRRSRAAKSWILMRLREGDVTGRPGKRRRRATPAARRALRPR